MKDLLKVVILLVLLVLMGIYLAGSASEKRAQSQANMFYARAHLAEVQNESLKILLAGLMPYTILGLGVLGATVVTVVISFIVFALLFVWMNPREMPR